jgi:PAS domain S-box-containing protein
MRNDKKRLQLLKVSKESFGFKVFVTFTFFIFIISFSFTFFFIGHQRDYLRETLIKKGKLLAEILAYNSRLGVFSENKEMLKLPVEGIFQQEEVLEAAVFNLKGQLLTKEQRSETGIPETSVERKGADRHTIFEMLMESSSSYYLEDNRKAEFWSPVISSSRYPAEDSSLFDEDGLFDRKEQIIGFVGITVDKGMLNKELHDLLVTSVLIGFAFLVIGSGITYLITKGVTRPLNRLTEGVKTLERGGIAEDVHIESRDEMGRLARAFNDMSKSLRTREQELRESEESYRELANSIADVFFAMDENLRYVYWNKASEELTGILQKDAIGKSLYELFPDTPETRRAETIYRKVLRTQKPRNVVNEYHLAGKRFFFDITAYPSEKGLSVFVKDITDQKKAEEALEQSQEHLRNLAAHLQSVREEERTAIAREIHDELGPALTGLKMDLSWLAEHIEEQPLLDKIRTMISLTDATVNTVRRISCNSDTISGRG